MKRSVVINAAWALVTVGLFVAGAHWGGTLTEGGPDGTPSPSVHRPSGSTLSGRQGPVAGAATGEGQARREREAGAELSDGDEERAERFPRLEALAREAARAGSPIERRRAFDRLLEEIRSPSFTTEQAIAVRKAMAEFGASGDQWRLFDYAWGAHHPADAIAHLAEIPERYRDAFLGNMLPGMASEHPGMAVEFFNMLDSELGARVRPRLLEGLVDNDVGGATDFIYDTTDLANYNWRPMDELSRELVRDQGLESALEWAGGLPEGPLRGSAWSAAYAAWTSKNPIAALESINELPAGTDRNLALNGFISALAPRDGERAVQWGEEITDPDLRRSALIRVGRHYFSQDQEAATAWFANSGLPQSAWQQVSTPR